MLGFHKYNEVDIKIINSFLRAQIVIILMTTQFKVASFQSFELENCFNKIKKKKKKKISYLHLFKRWS